MIITFATYSHTCIGFPRVVLKWAEEDCMWHEPYEWVRKNFASNVSVQG